MRTVDFKTTVLTAVRILEYTKLDPVHLLALPRMASLNAEWLAGFRHAWVRDAWFACLFASRIVM